MRNRARNGAHDGWRWAHLPSAHIATRIPLAEFERELICERTIAGLSSARARGRAGCQVKRDAKVGDLCKKLGVTRQTLYRFVGPQGELMADGMKLLLRRSQTVGS